MTKFIDGRTGKGAAYVSDRSGSPHARFLHLTSYALMPLGPLAAWYLAKAAGHGLEGVKAVIAIPSRRSCWSPLRRSRCRTPAPAWTRSSPITSMTRS